MEAVVDTNELISALIKPARSRELLCSSELMLYAPERIISESIAHKDEIISKAGITEHEFSMLMRFLLSRVIIVPNDEIKPFVKDALKLVTHEEDALFVALALSKKIPLWSEDKALKRQSSVKVLSTTELLKELGM